MCLCLRSTTLVSSGLYGTPTTELVPIYGSVTELPTYDLEAPDLAGESELTVGEVLAPRENPAESNVDPFLTEYNAVFQDTHEMDATALAKESSSGSIHEGEETVADTDAEELPTVETAEGTDNTSRPEQDRFTAQIESARRSLNSKVARQMEGGLSSQR